MASSGAWAFLRFAGSHLLVAYLLMHPNARVEAFENIDGGVIPSTVVTPEEQGVKPSETAAHLLEGVQSNAPGETLSEPVQIPTLGQYSLSAADLSNAQSVGLRGPAPATPSLGEAVQQSLGSSMPLSPTTMPAMSPTTIPAMSPARMPAMGITTMPAVGGGMLPSGGRMPPQFGTGSAPGGSVLPSAVDGSVLPLSGVVPPVGAAMTAGNIPSLPTGSGWENIYHVAPPQVGLPGYGFGVAPPSTPTSAGAAGKDFSRNAMVAGLSVDVKVPGSDILSTTVTDTRVPVGFHASASGTYVVPRFPSSVRSISEPTEEMIKHCMLQVTASKMTNGFSGTLKSGGVQVSGDPYHQLLRFRATSIPRYTSKVAAPVTLVQRLAGTKLGYESKLAVPPGCVLLPADPNLMVLVRQDGKYIGDVLVRLHPDSFATFVSSIASLPTGVLAMAAKLAPNSNFQPVGHCVFVAHFLTPPDTIQLMASFTEVRIIVATELDRESLGMKIPRNCLPQSPHRTAFWTTPVSNGTVVVVAFSPPPRSQNPWFVLPSVSDESVFNRTAARTA